MRIAAIDFVTAFWGLAVALLAFRPHRFPSQGDAINLERLLALKKRHLPSRLFDQDAVGLGFGRLGPRPNGGHIEGDRDQKQEKKTKPENFHAKPWIG